MILDDINDTKTAVDSEDLESPKDAIERIPDKHDAEDHAKILKKLDWHLLPLVSLLYFLSFLDRSNIANAKVVGMSTDLHLVGLRYNTAAAVFFIPYCLGQIPSNIVLKLFRPSFWIPTIMVAWGLVMTLMCFVKSYQGLVAARIFLGLAEAGLLPGVTYYISLWYPRAELAKRIAIFFSAATVAGAFGGLLAYAINKMDGIGHLRGWQWIFCLEGLATVFIALGCPLFMYDYPGTASFLTESERHHLTELMKANSQYVASYYDFRFILQAFRDYKTWLQFGIYIGVLIPGYAITLFMPTIINELGFSDTSAQLLSIPPFVLGAITTILVGVCSDKQRLRGPYVIGSSFAALAGYIILYIEKRPGASYIGAILAAMGTFPPVPVILAWAGSNAGGDLKCNVALAMVIGFGNLGGICSSFIYLDPPRFHIGHGTAMGWLSFSILLSAFAMWDYNRRNKQKVKVCRELGITDERKDEFRALGDDSPLFRYVL